MALLTRCSWSRGRRPGPRCAVCCVAAQQCSVDTRGGGKDLLVWAAHGPRARRPPEAAPAAERRDWRELMLSSCVVTPGGARPLSRQVGRTDGGVSWRAPVWGPGPGDEGSVAGAYFRGASGDWHSWGHSVGVRKACVGRGTGPCYVGMDGKQSWRQMS